MSAALSHQILSSILCLAIAERHSGARLRKQSHRLRTNPARSTRDQRYLFFQNHSYPGHRAKLMGCSTSSKAEHPWREARRPLGNVFLLELPIRSETLLNTLEIALRGRQRQYSARYPAYLLRALHHHQGRNRKRARTLGHFRNHEEKRLDLPGAQQQKPAPKRNGVLYRDSKN